MSKKEGTQVHLRVRPLSERELSLTPAAAARCLRVVDDTSLLYTGRDAPASNQFTFDRVLPEAATQEQAFEGLKGTVRAVLAGCNGTIIAYGQTVSWAVDRRVRAAGCSTERSGL